MMTRTLLALVCAGLLAGCGSLRGVPTDTEARRCNTNEALVCHNRTGSRLETDADEGRFCTCEPRIDY